MWHNQLNVYNTIDDIRNNTLGIVIPDIVDDDVLASLGFITVFQTPIPYTLDIEIAEPDGVEFVSDDYAKTKWKIVDRFKTYTDINGITITKEEQEIEYLTLKQKEYIPELITAVQARIALNDLGLRDIVENFASTNKKFSDYWEYSTTLNRSHSILEEARIAIGWSSSDIDNIFRVANKITF